MSRINECVKQLFLNRNAFLGRTVDKERLDQFFSRINPIKTEHALIRFGGERDGGYLIPNDLDGIDECFSPGVSTVADFELALAARGIKCFLADYSVDGPPVQSDLFDFEKKFIGVESEPKFMRLEDWILSKSSGSSELILQMDIEGAEYQAILDTPHEVLSRFRIMVLELHYLESLFDRVGFDLINSAFMKLLQNFEIVHIHPNNDTRPFNYGGYEVPPMMEVTFLRKDRISTRTPSLEFPHPLDCANDPNQRDYSLPSSWYKHG